MNRSISITVAVLMFILTACSNTQEKIGITYVKAPLNIPSIIEKNLQLWDEVFPADKYKVELLEITTGPEQLRALAAGSVQIANAIGGSSIIIGASNGVDIKILNVFSRSPKAFMILTNDENIYSIKDLKGQSVAGPKGTNLHQLLITALEKNQMTIQEINFLNMDISQALSALEAKKVPVVLLAGPAATQAIEHGARILQTGEGIMDAGSYVASSQSFLKSHPGIEKKILYIHNKALEYMKNYPEETWKIISQETGLSIENVKKMTPDYNFSPIITVEDKSNLEKTQQFLLKNQMIQKSIDLKTLFIGAENE